MPDTYIENPLFTTHTHKDSDWHHDGTYSTPRLSNTLAELLAGDYDVTNFCSNHKPTEQIPNPQPDVRERAEFLFGLSELLRTMMAIGQVEHTNDWDWFVQVWTNDGKGHGDYFKDGEAQDWETTPDEEIQYCDSFKTLYNEDSYQQMGIVPQAAEYYANLEVVLKSWDGGQKAMIEALKVGDISRIIISQR